MARFLLAVAVAACVVAGAWAQYFAGFAVRDISPTQAQVRAQSDRPCAESRRRVGKGHE